MNGYLNIELENNIELIILDILEYNNKKYFYIETKEEDLICIYNEEKNYLEKIVNQSEYEELYNKFKDRVNKKHNFTNYLDSLLENMIEVTIIDIKNNNYTLSIYDELINKNILFYNIKPTIGSKIYISKDVIYEINIFQYGKLYNYNMINENEIIKLIINDKEYYLQRYYG